MYRRFLCSLRHCRVIVDGVRQEPICHEEQRVLMQERRDHQLALQMQTGVAIPQEPGEPSEPPGELRENGARHDNDMINYREIRVVPTEQKALCLESPYLPSPTGSEHVPIPLDRHLDIQFRLLREDMMAATCRGMQGFLRERRLCHMGQHSDRVRVIGRGDDEEHADHNCTESVNLVAFRHVVVAEMVPWTACRSQ